MADTERPLTVVHLVAEWSQGYSTHGVHIGFDDDLVVFWELAPKENNAAYLYPAEALTEPWCTDIGAGEGAWLIPHIERFAAGEDIRRAVLAEYSERHGGQPAAVERWDWHR